MVGIISCTSLYPVMSAVMPSSISTASLSIFSCCAGRTGGSMVSSVSPCTLPCSMAFTWSGDIFLTPRPVSSLHAVTMSVPENPFFGHSPATEQNVLLSSLKWMSYSLLSSSGALCQTTEWGNAPGLPGKCTQIVLQLDAPVSTAITALMRGHFLLPVQDDDFFTINLDMYFFSHKRIRYGIMNIFHADS